jgi:hypothetical protein
VEFVESRARERRLDFETAVRVELRMDVLVLVHVRADDEEVKQTLVIQHVIPHARARLRVGDDEVETHRLARLRGARRGDNIEFVRAAHRRAHGRERHPAFRTHALLRLMNLRVHQTGELVSRRELLQRTHALRS